MSMKGIQSNERFDIIKYIKLSIDIISIIFMIRI
eukprot:UN08087